MIFPYKYKWTISGLRFIFEQNILPKIQYKNDKRYSTADEKQIPPQNISLIIDRIRNWKMPNFEGKINVILEPLQLWFKVKASPNIFLR